MTQDIVGVDLQKFNTPGSMGVVNDTRYIRCYWPALAEPTALFAEGSSGIEVQGPPTPRNVVFPEDTVALNVMVDDGPVVLPGEDGPAPRWRVTDIPTKIDCYFTTATEIKDVAVETKHSKTIEVEAGIFREVEYEKPGTEMKPVKVITDLTPSQAREMAIVVKAEAVIEIAKVER